ncbi:FBP domain-containing protein [Gulosibacter sp. 10]|uniref:FBP domain-containing protein n=1 Tax=Gulosibacter sp. 10 TaxID=1255570 RepID=UPI00097F0BE1|nr:FBP domain-containing protein [Gulosibacter sp. 10]SJM56246.1 hypothetical protein FM112_04620 [Gulosibacter sp. 10]
MLAINEKHIRTHFLNASKKERTELTLPEGLDAVDWDSLDYFGWRDPRISKRAYAFIPLESGEVVGVLFRQQTPPPNPQLCGWCHDVRMRNEVVFCSAKRSGPSGRNGNSVGVYVCQDFQCSLNVREDPPLPYDGFDQDAARTRRIDGLVERIRGFAANL